MQHEPVSPIKILHLEDSDNDAELIRYTLERAQLKPEILVASTQEAFCSALERQSFDLVLSDSSVPGFNALAALHQLTALPVRPHFICVTGAEDRSSARALLAGGAAEYVLKENLDRLPAAIRFALERPAVARTKRSGALALATAVQALSLARDVLTVRAIVRRAARELAGSDGATFVLRDGDLCHYVDEDAIGPLWKGLKFPLTACISGWTMLNRQVAVIPDIYKDPRIPVEAYRPTFVKSLVMVPIRASAPIGAIGNYWATSREATPQEVEMLQALADTTSVALENIQIHQELEQRVHDRTKQLHAANQELEAFSYSVSHDLRAPLRAIHGFTAILREDHGKTWTPEARRLFDRVSNEATRMGALIEDLLRLAQISRGELHVEPVDLSTLASETWTAIAAEAPERNVAFTVAPGLTARGDVRLLHAALTNLLSNAFKYTSRQERPATVEVGQALMADGTQAFFVRDNGAGFDSTKAARLFTPFQRMHTAAEFAGTGVGLATVQRILHRHGGSIWAESRPQQGATFYFVLPDAPAA